MKKYEDISSVQYALGKLSVLLALGLAGYTRPTIFVAPEGYAYGHIVAIDLGFNLEIDSALSSCEWYVEFMGNKFGSIGC